MKGYEWLQKAMNGELEPKTIIKTEHESQYFDDHKAYDYYIYHKDNMFHRCNEKGQLGAKFQDRFLNYKVLGKTFSYYCVLAEEEKKTKPLTKKDIEALGYACGEIQKCFTNGWTKSLENKPLEDEKKIPEKLPKWATTREDKEYTKQEDTILIVSQKVDEIIDYLDYLKSKGE